MILYAQVRGVMVRALEAQVSAPGGGSGSGEEDEIDDEPGTLRLHRVLAAIFAQCTRVSPCNTLEPNPLIP